MVGRRELIKRGGAALVATGIANGLNSPSVEATSLKSDDPKHYALIVLDRSGSMGPLKAAVTESINTFLDQQSGNRGMYISLVQFDSYTTLANTYCDPIFEFTATHETPRLGPNDYQPRGGTPLLAAVAEGINRLEHVLGPYDRALMVFQTDGGENSSPREITIEVVKNLIKAKEAEGNWTFAFLGADIDAWSTGGSIGMQMGSTMAYTNTANGTQAAYAATAAATTRWYAATAGGQSIGAVMSAPANVNADFFTSPTTTANETTVTINSTTVPNPKKAKDDQSKP